MQKGRLYGGKKKALKGCKSRKGRKKAARKKKKKGTGIVTGDSDFDLFAWNWLNIAKVWKNQFGHF